MNQKIFLCSICNINSGTCNEDCKFCARDAGALGFCLVTADKGLNDKTLEFVCSVAKAVAKVAPELRLIACNGTATLEQLLVLKESGIKAYNHNLETSQSFYPQICTTHPWSQRYETCQNVNKANMVLITGGIFGLGESQEDRISMIESLNSLNPSSVPINFYHHNEALELQPNPLNVDEALELVKLTREMIPNAQRIMVAGGRELMFGERQNEIFKNGANSIVIGNYLTTAGREMNKDLEMLESLNLEIATKVK